MTVPASLFVEAPEVQDRALTKLDSDSNAWPEEILQKLREKAPIISNMAAMVKFMKKDEENGAATGSIVVSAPDTSFVVPIIIRDFLLSPLDVMIAKSKILPLTQDYVKSILDKNDTFAKVEEYPTYGGLGRFEDANLWSAIYPPSLGRYAYASAGYPLIDELSDTISGSEVKQWLQDNHEYAMNFLTWSRRYLKKSCTPATC